MCDAGAEESSRGAAGVLHAYCRGGGFVVKFRTLDGLGN